MPELEVITIGRVSVDLYPEQIGVALKDVKTFAKSLGGSPTNVAVAAARLGRRSAVITKVGDDGFGTHVRQALRGFGVRMAGSGPTPRCGRRWSFARSILPMTFHFSSTGSRKPPT